MVVVISIRRSVIVSVFLLCGYEVRTNKGCRALFDKLRNEGVPAASGKVTVKTNFWPH
jgi:hypothetical protein